MANLIYSALPQPRRPLVYVNSMQTIAQCIDKMIQDNIGALVVLEGKEVLGVVSERDIVRACLDHNLDLYKTTASEIVYRDVSFLNLFDTVEKAMEVITQTKRRHVLVEENNELVAILSIGDLLYYLLEDKIQLIEQLENYIHTY